MGLATCLHWGVCSQPDFVLFLPFPSTALLSFRFCVYDNYSNKGFVISIYLKELTRYKIIEKIFCKSDFCCLWRGKERLESKPSLLHSNTLCRLAGKSPHLVFLVHWGWCQSRSIGGIADLAIQRCECSWALTWTHKYLSKKLLSHSIRFTAA